MATEVFIELVKNEGIIWDMRSPEYKNMGKKTMAWVAIAEEMCMSVTDCKKKWKSLRDAFARENRKRKFSQDGEDLKEKWRYYNQLTFLLKNLQPRKNIYVDSFIDYETIIPGDEIQCHTDNSSCGSIKTERAFENELTSTMGTLKCPTDNSSCGSPSSVYCPPTKRTMKSEKAFEKELTATMGTLKSFMEKGDDEDEDSLFCASLLRKIKKFPLKDKNALKVQILIMANEKEEELFSKN